MAGCPIEASYISEQPQRPNGAFVLVLGQLPSGKNRKFWGFSLKVRGETKTPFSHLETSTWSWGLQGSTALPAPPAQCPSWLRDIGKRQAQPFSQGKQCLPAIVQVENSSSNRAEHSNKFWCSTQGAFVCECLQVLEAQALKSFKQTQGC